MDGGLTEAVLPSPAGSEVGAASSFKPPTFRRLSLWPLPAQLPRHSPHLPSVYPASDSKLGPMLGTGHKTQHLSRGALGPRGGRKAKS